MLNDKEFDDLMRGAEASRRGALFPYDVAIDDLITEARAMREALTWKPIEEAVGEEGQFIVARFPDGSVGVFERYQGRWRDTEDDDIGDYANQPELFHDPAALIMPEVGP